MIVSQPVFSSVLKKQGVGIVFICTSIIAAPLPVVGGHRFPDHGGNFCNSARVLVSSDAVDAGDAGDAGGRFEVAEYYWVWGNDRYTVSSESPLPPLHRSASAISLCLYYSELSPPVGGDKIIPSPMYKRKKLTKLLFQINETKGKKNATVRKIPLPFYLIKVQRNIIWGVK